MTLSQAVDSRKASRSTLLKYKSTHLHCIALAWIGLDWSGLDVKVKVKEKVEEKVKVKVKEGVWGVGCVDMCVQVCA